jgi:hypothetical protein
MQPFICSHPQVHVPEGVKRGHDAVALHEKFRLRFILNFHLKVMA